MIFPAKKDLSIGLIFLTVTLIGIASAGIIIDGILHSGDNGLLLIVLLVMLVIGFLGWLWFDTCYMIDGNKLVYHSGPFRGKLALDGVTRITRNQTMSIGLKIALAQNGMIIRYGKWNEIYVAPQNEERMIAEILKINPDIEVE